MSSSPLRMANIGVAGEDTGATASAGFCEARDFPGRYPRLQILTIAELLAGKKLEYPTHRVETFARAERKTKSQQEGLF